MSPATWVIAGFVFVGIPAVAVVAHLRQRGRR